MPAILIILLSIPAQIFIGQLLKPSIIDQYELGIKNNFFNRKLSANLSIYRIINSNLAQQAEFKADGTLNSDATVKELKGQTTSDGSGIGSEWYRSQKTFISLPAMVITICVLQKHPAPRVLILKGERL